MAAEGKGRACVTGGTCCVGIFHTAALCTFYVIHKFGISITWSSQNETEPTFKKRHNLINFMINERAKF